MALNLLSGMTGVGGGVGSSFLTQMLSAGRFGGGPMAMPNFGGFDRFHHSGEMWERGNGRMPSFLMGNQFGFQGGQGLLDMGQPGNGGAMFGLPGGGAFNVMGGDNGFNGSPFGGSPFGQGGANQMTQMLGMLMGLMMQMMQRMGGQQQGCGGPGGFGGTNPLQMGGPGQGQGGGHELQKGQSYTTRGGSTISWQNDEVQVHDAGGGDQCFGGGKGQGQGSFALSGKTPNGGTFALAGAFNNGGQAQGGQQSQGAQDWKVFGDPHIKNPNGQQTDYNRNGGLFTLSDGTRVEIEADGPGQVTKRVIIFDQGAQLGGFDANNTTDYGKAQNGQFQDHGTVAQTMGQAGFQSPFGNNLFG